MSIFNFADNEALGKVFSVDTASVMVRVDDLDKLKSLQVNRLSVLQSSRPGQHLVGIVSKITRRSDDAEIDVEGSRDSEPSGSMSEITMVKITLIGTFNDRIGEVKNVFRRTLETVPEIDANCFSLEGDRLTEFMRAISEVELDGPKLSLGHFTLDENAVAYLNGNRLFQRHALIVGSTGSGKSWTTARLLEEISKLPQANVVLFDIHGEYKPLQGDEFRHYRIAGPSDIDSARGLNQGVLHLPYWLLGYEAIISMFVSRSDQNAPNQAMLMTNAIINAKRKTLNDADNNRILENFTIDSPIPFDIDSVLEELKDLNEERVPGQRGDKNGPNFDKLTRVIARLEAKRDDRRLAFLFQPPKECNEMGWLPYMVQLISAGRCAQQDGKGGIKVIDFSEVPSDVLPLMVSSLAQILFSTTLWTVREKRHPIAIMCDEAHLYIPERAQEGGASSVAVEIFERIAKEGRKYGIGLVVTSQRPSEVNRTVLSQCNNVIAMRLTNADDQNVIRRLLPDSLGGFGDLLPILDVGEAIVVGDASLLPTRLRVDEPIKKPNSQTVAFWDRWNDQKPMQDTFEAIASWRRQSIK